MREMRNSRCCFNAGFDSDLAFDERNLRRYENLSPLKDDEIDVLEGNGCTADDWGTVRVRRPFDAALVRNCEFHGKVAIGRLEKGHIAFCGSDFALGLYNSRIASSIIDDYPAISESSVSDSVIGRNVAIHGCSEISSFAGAFSRPNIVNLGNEKCGREAVLFGGITLFDLWMQINFKEDADFQNRLSEFTKAKIAASSPYTYVGDGCVLENCRAIRSVKLGRRSVISGAARVEESYINSASAECTSICDNAIVLDSVLEPGCRIESGSFVEKCFLDRFVAIKQGARVLQSAVGRNSTIACAEVQCCFLGPLHEQHHNSSFLIAATIGGQCNIASGATLGSNHNSRSNDGELHAGRGFWAGLCTSVKHNSAFAPFTLLAKSDFMHELNITLPFSLVSDSRASDSLSVMPAYWWRHNMYALFRNNGKFEKRLGRCKDGIECSFLAPDTAVWILRAIDFLNKYKDRVPDHLLENSRRKVELLGVGDALAAYSEMLLWYAASTVFAWIGQHGSLDMPQNVDFMQGWYNVCGVLVSTKNIDALISDIKGGKIISWEDAEERFERFKFEYPKEKFSHAFALLKSLYKLETIDSGALERIKDDYDALDAKVKERIKASRDKDFGGPFAVAR